MKNDTTGSLLALALSGVVHVGFGAWVATRPEPTVVPRTVEAEMIFTEVTPPPAPTPPPEAPKPPEAPPPKVATRDPVRPPPRQPSTPPPPSRPEPPPADVPSDTPTDVPRAADPTDVPRAAPTLRVGLVPDSSFVLRVDAGVQREVEVVNGGGLHGLEAPKDVVGLLTKETLGRGKVDRGLVHPYYSQLGKALLKNWDADRVARSGLKGLAEQTQQNLKLYNEIWAERAQAYATTGNPMGDTGPSNNRRAAVNDRVGGLPNGVDLEQRKEMARAMKEQFKAVRRAIIRVVQDTEGKLLKVELVQPSQDSNVDREALQDVKTAAEKLPPPPAEALEGKTTLTSLWSFELIVSISPPVPTFNFEFDEALGFIDARLPLDRRIYKKVRLYSVE